MIGIRSFCTLTLYCICVKMTMRNLENGRYQQKTKIFLAIITMRFLRLPNVCPKNPINKPKKHAIFAWVSVKRRIFCLQVIKFFDFLLIILSLVI